MASDTVRIPVDTETRDRLRGMKVGNETYDDVIRREVFSEPMEVAD